MDVYFSLPLGDPGYHAVQVFVFVLNVGFAIGSIMCSQQFLCLKEIA